MKSGQVDIAPRAPAWQILSLAGLAIFACASMVYAISDAGAIMKCDPTKDLAKGMDYASVLVLCGAPYREKDERGAEAYYPLRGETAVSVAGRGDQMLVYGDISDKKRNVNLYFTDGKLRSVQIFGGWK